MIREILFRAKTVKNVRWVCGDLFHAGTEPSDGEFVICYWDDEDGWMNENVQPGTIGQFTGLLDRNGKRIFEHDIVRRHTTDGYEIDRIGVVFYDEKSACFKIRWYIDEIWDKRESNVLRRIESLSSKDSEIFKYSDCFGGQSPYTESYNYVLLGNEFDNKELLQQ